MYRKISVLALGLLLLAGCSGTTNPREGGLFSYNPNAYEQRLKDRQNILVTERDREDQNVAERESLEAEKNTKTQRLAAEQKKLNRLKKELQQSKARLNNLKASNAAQEQQLEQLKAQQHSLDAQSNSLGEIDTDQKRRQLENLQKQARDLLRKAEALERM